MMAGVLRGLFTDMAPEVAMKYDIKKSNHQMNGLAKDVTI